MQTKNPDEIVKRAKSMIGARLTYVLGGGGRDPNAQSPATRVFAKDGTVRIGCDCVGFTAWASGFDRLQKNFPLFGGWINTDSGCGEWNAKEGKYQPAKGWFELLAKPEVGCWIVYPSIDLNHDGVRERIGHAGIVSHVEADWTFANTRVIHCNSKASRESGGYAVTETDASLWGRAISYRGKSDKRWAAQFLKPVF